MRATPLVKVRDLLPLRPLRVRETSMSGVMSRGADISRIRTVMFENAHSGLFEEGPQLSKVLNTPTTPEARRMPEDGPFGRPGFGIDNVIFRAYISACQQGVASQGDSLLLTIVHQIFCFLNVTRILIFGVDAAPERDDH